MGEGRYKALFAALMGSAALAAGTLGAITSVEGYRPVGYRDIGGVATNCSGNTHAVAIGKQMTDAECAEIDARNAVTAAQDVKRATPKLQGNQLKAAVLFTVNLGGPTYARSTATRQFNAGELRAGCDALQRYVNITSKKPVRSLTCRRSARGWTCGPVKGLQNRRAYEHKICVDGLK
jgi:lysozyme